MWEGFKTALLTLWRPLSITKLKISFANTITQECFQSCNMTHCTKCATNSKTQMINFEDRAKKWNLTMIFGDLVLKIGGLNGQLHDSYITELCMHSVTINKLTALY